jgi:hypothetical protein
VAIRLGAALACLLLAGAAAFFSPEADESMPLNARHAAHPLDTEVSIELGLELERGGHFMQAEETLLHAAHCDHQLLPAWTLTNFYFRQERTEDFWMWAARAATLTYDDFRPLLQLASTWEANPARIVDHLGNRPQLLRAYVDLLIGQGRASDARVVGRMLAAHKDANDRERLAAISRLP